LEQLPELGVREVRRLIHRQLGTRLPRVCELVWIHHAFEPLAGSSLRLEVSRSALDARFPLEALDRGQQTCGWRWRLAREDGCAGPDDVGDEVVAARHLHQRQGAPQHRGTFYRPSQPQQRDPVEEPGLSGDGARRQEPLRLREQLDRRVRFVEGADDPRVVQRRTQQPLASQPVGAPYELIGEDETTLALGAQPAREHEVPERKQFPELVTGGPRCVDSRRTLADGLFRTIRLELGDAEARDRDRDGREAGLLGATDALLVPADGIREPVGVVGADTRPSEQLRTLVRRQRRCVLERGASPLAQFAEVAASCQNIAVECTTFTNVSVS
jgi:hypothetical protein